MTQPGKEGAMRWSLLGVMAVLVCVAAAEPKPDDAVARAILSGSPVPRDIQAIRHRLQTELGGVLKTHIVANGGHDHPTRRGVMFMCFESYAGPSPAGAVDEGGLFLGDFLGPGAGRLAGGAGFLGVIPGGRPAHPVHFWGPDGP